MNEWVEKQELAKRNGVGRKHSGLKISRSKDPFRGMKERLSVVARKGPPPNQIDPPPLLPDGLGSPTQPRAPAKSSRDLTTSLPPPTRNKKLRFGGSRRAIPLMPRGKCGLADCTAGGGTKLSGSSALDASADGAHQIQVRQY